jgi:hypothetical protein
MIMKPRLFHVLSGILILSFFGCNKELSYEIPANGGNNSVAGDFRAKIDSVQWVAANNTKGATILNGVINISGVSSDNKMISITLVGQSTGTYPVDINSPGIAAYNEITNGIITSSFATNGSADTSQSGGSVTITAIDKTKKTISGTFHFNGFDANSGVRKVVSEGVFNQLPYTTSLPPANSTDTFRVKIGGVAYSAQSISTQIISGQIYVQGAPLDGSSSVGIYMPQSVQPGSYTLDFSGGTYIGQYSPDPIHILVSQGAGTLTIIQNDATARRIKGNFNFTASDLGHTQTAQLTEGYFSVRY